MTFLNGALLWLLPLAALPILLHLLTLLRLRTVELSTFRFLFDSYLQQRRRMRFLEALLAMLRTAFLLVLVLAVARPMVRHWGDLFQGGSGGREVLLLVDCSASMNAQTAGQSAFDRAKGAAQAVARRLQPEDRVTLVRVANRPEVVFSRFSSDAEAIAARIGDLSPTPARANFFAAFTELFGPEAPKYNRPLVYLFTDGQASGWGEVRRQPLDRVLPPQTQVVVVNVGSREPVPNQAVVGDAPARRRAVVGLPVRLRARVVNHSPKPAEVTLSTFVDDKEVARHRLALKPGETVTRRVIYTPHEPGTHRGRFEITGNKDDRFPDDDRFLFTLAAVPRVKVLLVNGSPSPDPEADEALYLRAVSAVFADAPEDKKPAPDRGRMGSLRELARSIDLKQVPEGGLTADGVRDAGVVILANCGGLNDPQFALLRQYVADGGGLLVFPGDRVNPEVYNTRFFPVPGVPGESLTPVRLGPPQGDPAKFDTFEGLANLDFAHPVLAVFDDPERQVPYFKNVLFYRRFPLTVAEKQAGAWPLAEFASGAPALVENRYGDGRVVVAGFPVNRKWSNLPTENGKEFVPLMLRLISRVQRRADLEARPVAAPGDVAELSVAGAWNPAECKVTDPEGRSTLVSLERSGSRLVGAFERTTRRGYYTVEARPEQAELGKGAALDFAVNLAAEESDFRTVDPKEFPTLLPAAKVSYVDASAEAQQVRSLADDLEEPIWRPLIYLLFVIIGVEFLLATLGGRRNPIAEEPEGTERVRQYRPGGWMGRLTGAAREKA